MEADAIIKKCIEKKITLQQFFIVWCIYYKDYDTLKDYLEIDQLTEHDLRSLCDKKFLEDFNSPNAKTSYPEMFMVPDEVAEAFFVTENHGYEFYDIYPSTFPLYDKGSVFIAKSMPRDDVADLYLKHVRSRNKHEFVMKQVPRYEKLVKSGKVNGHKIVDFIRSEMWNVVAELWEQSENRNDGSDI